MKCVLPHKRNYLFFLKLIIKARFFDKTCEFKKISAAFKKKCNPYYLCCLERENTRYAYATCWTSLQKQLHNHIHSLKTSCVWIIIHGHIFITNICHRSKLKLFDTRKAVNKADSDGFASYILFRSTLRVPQKTESCCCCCDVTECRYLLNINIIYD